MLQRYLDGVLNRGTLCHIAGNRQDAGATAEPFPGAQQFFPVTRKQYHSRTVFSELSRHQQAKSARTASDYGDAAGIREAITVTS
jgi:hypothetical protein